MCLPSSAPDQLPPFVALVIANEHRSCQLRSKAVSQRTEGFLRHEPKEWIKHLDAS